MERDMSEFKAFLEGNIAPPGAVESQLFEKIQALLSPPLVPTMAKLLAIHLVGSFVTLLFCPQFGLGFVSPLAKATEWLMDINPALCFLMCGCLWGFGGEVLTSFVMNIDERRVSNRYKLGAVFSLLLLVILAFACLGRVTFDQWLGWWFAGAVSVTLAGSLVYNLKAKRRVAYT